SICQGYNELVSTVNLYLPYKLNLIKKKIVEENEEKKPITFKELVERYNKKGKKTINYRKPKSNFDRY
ncbi:unnamed protein product, partial [marine sediment metagenome]